VDLCHRVANLDRLTIVNPSSYQRFSLDLTTYSVVLRDSARRPVDPSTAKEPPFSEQIEYNRSTLPTSHHDRESAASTLERCLSA
jgi:hypothetical protein